MDISKIASQSDLKNAILGQSDEDINRTLGADGVAIVMRVAETMKDHFLADKAKGQKAVIQYDVKAPDGVHSFHLQVGDDRCEVAAGKADAPRVTLKALLPDFLRIVTGDLPGMQAFFTGKVQVSGDVMFAQIMEGWFRIH